MKIVYLRNFLERSNFFINYTIFLSNTINELYQFNFGRFYFIWWVLLAKKKISRILQ